MLDIDAIRHALEIEDPKKRDSFVEQWNAYEALLDTGIITQEEFDAKKRELLEL